jgi:hypothetical protein
MTTQELRRELTAHLGTVTPPPGDLDAVRRRGRTMRTRRVVGPGLLAAAAVGVGALVLSQTGPAPGGDGTGASGPIAASGRLDLSHGLRAYASPSERLHLGGTSIELTPDISYLDTDAAATPYGLLYTDPQGRIQLIGESGTSEALTGQSDTPRDWHPTIKADPARSEAVWATLDGDDVTLTVYDLAKRAAIARTDVTCGLQHPSAGGSADDCADFVIDAVDSGSVFLRGPDGTKVWDYDTGEWFSLAGPKTRVADARSKVVLFTGPAPTESMDGWRYVPGKIDAQLTLDGKHVLYWSSTLQPTSPGGDPIVLEEGPSNGEGLAWWTVDTDGSILVAVAQSNGKMYTGDNLVYDCEVPSGRCTSLGSLKTPSGDPMFMGDDM